MLDPSSLSLLSQALGLLFGSLFLCSLASLFCFKVLTLLPQLLLPL